MGGTENFFKYKLTGESYRFQLQPTVTALVKQL